LERLSFDDYCLKIASVVAERSTCRRHHMGGCCRLGCVELEVSTEKTNAAARRFYRQCGFDEDAVLLEMAL
jgi:deoxycytidylate deaminase